MALGSTHWQLQLHLQPATATRMLDQTLKHWAPTPFLATRPARARVSIALVYLHTWIGFWRQRMGKS